MTAASSGCSPDSLVGFTFFVATASPLIGFCGRVTGGLERLGGEVVIGGVLMFELAFRSPEFMEGLWPAGFVVGLIFPSLGVLLLLLLLLLL